MRPRLLDHVKHRARGVGSPAVEQEVEVALVRFHLVSQEKRLPRVQPQPHPQRLDHVDRLPVGRFGPIRVAQRLLDARDIQRRLPLELRVQCRGGHRQPVTAGGRWLLPPSSRFRERSLRVPQRLPQAGPVVAGREIPHLAQVAQRGGEQRAAFAAGRVPGQGDDGLVFPDGGPQTPAFVTFGRNKFRDQAGRARQRAQPLGPLCPDHFRPRPGQVAEVKMAERPVRRSLLRQQRQGRPVVLLCLPEALDMPPEFLCLQRCWPLVGHPLLQHAVDGDVPLVAVERIPQEQEIAAVDEVDGFQQRVVWQPPERPSECLVRLAFVPDCQERIAGLLRKPRQPVALHTAPGVPVGVPAFECGDGPRFRAQQVQVRVFVAAHPVTRLASQRPQQDAERFFVGLKVLGDRKERTVVA